MSSLIREMKYCLWLLLFIIVSTGESSAHTDKVKKGVLDLREIRDIHSFSLRMNGEWEFYYNRFVQPGDSAGSLIPDCYSKVPSYWTDNKECPKVIKGTGYASYRCIVLLPPGAKAQLGFDIPVFDTSYEMLINGRILVWNGRTGKSREESSPKYNPIILKYAPSSDTLDIVIHVSNFVHKKGGFWLPMKIGSFIDVQRGFSRGYILCMAFASMLFFSFCFFFLLFILDKRNIKALLFSLIVFTLALSPFFSSPFLITLFGFSDWYFIEKAEYIIIAILLVTAIGFVMQLYPNKAKKHIIRISVYCFFAYLLFVLFASSFIVSYTEILITSIASVIILYSLFMSFKGAMQKKLDDVLYFVAFLAMAFGAYSDISLALGTIRNSSIYIGSHTMLIFVFIHSMVMIKGWVRNAREKESLNVKLEELAKHLEEKIEERTAELVKKSTEIETQNQCIVKQNKRLSDIVHVKNQLFSVISHDLRSPIVNILYGLNMIKEEKSEKQKEILTDSCIQSSQMAINLLENILVWGREQEDMIHYSPGYNDLADIILTNMSICKESADRKDISLNFTQIGSSKGWFDKDLMDIIIRNILSNAIKFTNHNGKIFIVLMEGDKTNEGLTIKITDNGVGMSADMLENLFSGKYIQSTYGTDNEKGTGIGLRLVYELIKISQSSISVESTVGEGTCFTIVLSDSKTNMQ